MLVRRGAARPADVVKDIFLGAKYSLSVVLDAESTFIYLVCVYFCYMCIA